MPEDFLTEKKSVTALILALEMNIPPMIERESRIASAVASAAAFARMRAGSHTVTGRY